MWCLEVTLALLMLVVAALWRCSSAFRYRCKFALFVATSLVWATAPIPLMLLRPRDPRNALLPAWGLRRSARLLGLRAHVRGRRHIVPPGQGCVVLINHQSALDLLVLAELWPVMPRCTVVSKREVFWLGPFGLATWLWGTVFIDRRDGGSARATVNAAGRAIRSRRARVLMFPEGTRHGGPQLLPFKKGAFHLALAAACPVQPVVVSRYHFLDAAAGRFDSGRLVISILPPVSTAGLADADLPRLVDDVRRTMADEYARLSAETAADAHSKAL